MIPKKDDLHKRCSHHRCQRRKQNLTLINNEGNNEGNFVFF